MDSLQSMNQAMKYIEENLTDQIDVREVARRAYCSEYHFKRMFSFLAGVSLSEYIRRRKLTLAAFDLKDSHMKVIDVALKYGYTSPDSFASISSHAWNHSIGSEKSWPLFKSVSAHDLPVNNKGRI